MSSRKMCDDRQAPGLIGMVENSAGTMAEIIVAFLKQGLSSFGGPIAHLGYFREEFVERRKWVSDRCYSDFVAVCLVMPGRASS